MAGQERSRVVASANLKGSQHRGRRQQFRADAGWCRGDLCSRCRAPL